MSFRRTATAVYLVLAPVLYSQIRSATITGTVKDAAGGVVPDAVVTVTQQETDIVTSIKTTAAGVYTAPYLPAGTYTVAVSQPGFTVYKQTGVPVAVNQTVRIDVDLKVGAVEQSVEVTAQAAQIQTDSSTVQGAVESQVINAIPNHRRYDVAEFVWRRRAGAQARIHYRRERWPRIHQRHPVGRPSRDGRRL